jgi:hypothetical protein
VALLLRQALKVRLCQSALCTGERLHNLATLQASHAGSVEQCSSALVPVKTASTGKACETIGASVQPFVTLTLWRGLHIAQNPM